jgi:hypothetical protein
MGRMLRLGSLLIAVALVASACGPTELPAFANPPPDDAAVDDLDAGLGDASR